MGKQQNATVVEYATDQSSFELPPKYAFSVFEVAELLGVNHKTIREQITAGRIHVTRLGRVIRIPRAEVTRLLGG